MTAENGLHILLPQQTGYILSLPCDFVLKEKGTLNNEVFNAGRRKECPSWDDHS